MKPNDTVYPESYVGADSPHEGVGMGLTVRDHIAIKAPITYNDVYGILRNKAKCEKYKDRSAVTADARLQLLTDISHDMSIEIKFLDVFALLVRMKYEYADAMIEESNK